MNKISNLYKALRIALIVIILGLVTFILSPYNKFVWDQEGVVHSVEKKEKVNQSNEIILTPSDDEKEEVSEDNVKQQEEAYLKELTSIYEGFDEERTKFEGAFQSTGGDIENVFTEEMGETVDYFWMRFEIYSSDLVSLIPPKSLEELHYNLLKSNFKVMIALEKMLYDGIRQSYEEKFMEAAEMYDRATYHYFRDYLDIESMVKTGELTDDIE